MDKIKVYNNMVSTVRDQLWLLLLANNCSIYLYYKEGTETDYGELIAATEYDNISSDYNIVTGQPIPRSMNKDQLYQWIRRMTSRLPLLIKS